MPDCDVFDPAAAAAIQDMVRERFEERGYVPIRFGQAPKFAIPFRTNEPFAKITAKLIAPNGNTDEKIELLCDGQQLAIAGIHPATGKPYSWHGGLMPGKIGIENLSCISEIEARTLVTDIVDLLIRDHGYARPEAPKGNGADQHCGASDWSDLVGYIIAGHELHDSTCSLAAKLIVSGIPPLSTRG
jgi:hypothetical protein